jgi:hypothetical protein
MVVAVDCSAATSYGSTIAEVIEKTSGGLSLDPMDDFSGGMQIMNDDLTQRDGCEVAAVQL